VPKISTLFSFVPPISLIHYDSIPILVRRVAVKAFGAVELNRSILMHLNLALQPTHLLQIGAMSASLAPDNVCVDSVILH
jgi:hypothetical protein